MRRAPAELPAGDAADVTALADGYSGARKMQAQMADRAQLQERMEAETLDAIRVPKAGTNKTEVLAKYLRETLKKDSLSPAQTLRTWVNEKA